MFFNKSFFKKKIGQGLVEFCLIFCIVAIAGGAIASTETSFRDLMVTLGKNIANQGVFEKNEDGGVNLTMSLPTIESIDEVWGIKTAPTETAKFGDIVFNPDRITVLPDSDTRGTGGLYAPIAQFEVVAGSTYDETLYYDLSYDPDGGDSSWLQRYWLIKRTTKKDTPNETTCASNPTCVGATSDEIFDINDSTNIEQNSVHSNQFSFNKTEGMTGEINQQQTSSYYHYCMGTAKQCLPKHFSNGVYQITLVVKDRDNKYSSPKTVSFEISTKSDYRSYVEVVTETDTKYTSDGNENDKYVALVDHEFGLIKDLYGVEHVVIQNNMLRTSVSSTWTIKTTSTICRYETLIDGKTGIEKWRNPVADECWTQTTTVEDMEGMGDAGFKPSDDNDSGNMWTQTQLQKNNWKFYVYDKRSLYYKKLIGNQKTNNNEPTSPEFPKSTTLTTADFNSISTKTGSQGVWKVVDSGQISFSSLPNKNSATDKDYRYSGIRLLCTPEAIEALKGNNLYSSRNSSCAEGKTNMYSYADHPLDNVTNELLPKNIIGFNNDGGDNGKPNTTSEPSIKKGTDMDKHTDYFKGASDFYKTTCAGLGCASKWTAFSGTVKEKEIGNKDLVLQITSNYKYYYGLSSSDAGDDKTIPNQYRVDPTDENRTESIEAVYRDGSPDFNDGSLMYQLRQNAPETNRRKGTAVKGEDGKFIENDYDPEFASVRLSLADNSAGSYNPGWDAYSNRPFDGSGQGCAECTEPNYNVDTKMRWTEVREIKIPTNSSVTRETCIEPKGRETITYNHSNPGYTTYRNARTRQMNIVEHFAFDWVYEYSGSGRVASTPNTYKIKRAHWHTMGRTSDTIVSGQYDNPYVENKATDDARYDLNNNPKRVFTDTDKSNLSAKDGGPDDKISDRDYWKVLNGTIDVTLPTGNSITHTHSASYSDSCGCSCSSGGHSCSTTIYNDVTYSGYVDIDITWVGVSDLVLNGNGSNGKGYYTEKYYTRSRDTGWYGYCSATCNCYCPPPSPPSGGGGS